MLVLGFDGVIDRRDGLILFAALPFYLAWNVLASRRESSRVKHELAHEVVATAASRPDSVLGRLLLIGVGVGMLGVGSSMLVDGSVTIAERLGVSQLVIGLTILAVGTSLPEVATCVIASFRGHYDMAVGNVVGSNILNILAVLGLPAAVASKGISVPAEALLFDIPVMIAVSVACLPIFITALANQPLGRLPLPGLLRVVRDLPGNYRQSRKRPDPKRPLHRPGDHRSPHGGVARSSRVPGSQEKAGIMIPAVCRVAVGCAQRTTMDCG